MHRINKDLGTFRINELMNAVTQVEYVTVARTKALQNVRHLGTNTIRRCVQHTRIHVALQRHAITDTATGVIDIGGPVQTQGIGTGFGHHFQPLPAVLGKQDHRHAAAFVFTDKTIHYLLHVLE